MGRPAVAATKWWAIRCSRDGFVSEPDDSFSTVSEHLYWINRSGRCPGKHIIVPVNGPKYPGHTKTYGAINSRNSRVR